MGEFWSSLEHSEKIKWLNDHPEVMGAATEVAIAGPMAIPAFLALPLAAQIGAIVGAIGSSGLILGLEKYPLELVYIVTGKKEAMEELKRRHRKKLKEVI
jgi:hypothetical protein